MQPGLSAAALGFTLLAGALQADEQVSPLHPRIYVCHDEARVGKGLTVSELRRRLKDPEYARWHRPAGGQGASAMVERAARYLEDANPADLDAVRNFLLTHTFSYAKHDVGGFLAGAEMATAFDWIYAGLSLEDRAAAMANIVTTAETSRSFLLRGAPDINHNYTYMALSTLAVCGLVLKGEAEPYNGKGVEYLRLARKWLESPGKVLDTWKAREGAWAEGSLYTFHETLRTLVLALVAYRTASDTDYFGSKYRGPLIQAGRFLIASTRPDMTFERVGDCLPSRALANGTVPLTVEMLAFGLDGEEAARLRSFSRALREAYGEKALHPSFDWGMRIFFERAAAREPSYHTLPTAMRMGAGTYEQIVFRGGWRPDSTQVTILAGDHFTDHQHFDKGHFLIYRRGGLAIDGGAYDGMYKPGHWNDYACRTVAHNCVLVHDPDQRFPTGYANDGGQNVIRGKQHHADWNAYLAHREGEGLHTAEVAAYDYDQNSGYGYVRANLTKAYGEKVSSYDRQFVYLPGPDFLVVFNRVSAAHAGFAKRWLLHFQEAPSVDGITPEPGIRTFPGARLTSARRQGQLEPGGSTVAYNGALFVRTLLPAAHTITVVGGPGYEYFNLFTRLNYPPSNAALAADVREPGNWRIEVSPDVTSADDQFLHALQMADGSAARPVDARLLEAGEKKLAGVQFLSLPENQVVLFASGQRGGAPSFPLSYEISSASSARHYLAELPASKQVVVEVNGKKMPIQKVSSQGVLVFRDRSKGARKIVIRSQ